MSGAGYALCVWENAKFSYWHRMHKWGRIRLLLGEQILRACTGLQVVPILTKLFASSDRGIRRGLLENIATYGPALPDKIVEEQVGACAGTYRTPAHQACDWHLAWTHHTGRRLQFAMGAGSDSALAASQRQGCSLACPDTAHPHASPLPHCLSKQCRFITMWPQDSTMATRTCVSSHSSRWQC